jgi:predicted O-methyltransferase YrrM
MRTMSVLGNLVRRGRTRRWLLRQLRRVQAVLAVLRRPPWVPPGHFYSPVSTREDVERQLSWDGPPAGVDLREDEQVALLQELAPYLTDFVPIRYRAHNEQYDVVDATFLQAMLRHHRPRRIIEVGSGHSTMATLDTADHHLPDLEITCIEPFPDRLLGLLSPRDAGRIRLIREPVQDVPPEVFVELRAGDVLFIDSTHVVRHGSDVLWETLHLLPSLAPGVLVHVHDLQWPFQYPERWLREGRDWTEIYLWHAFLAYNEAWPIRLMTSWAATNRPDLLPPALRDLPTGALWIQRAGPVGG